MDEVIRKGDIWMVNLSLVVGSEQGGVRPCCVLGNDIGNKFSPVVMICPITSKVKRKLPIHVELNLKEESIALIEQTRVVDKFRLMYKLGEATPEDIVKLNKALIINFALEDYIDNSQIKKDTILA